MHAIDRTSSRRRFVLAAAGSAAFALTPLALARQEIINVLTGGPSGVYFSLGVALSQIWSKALPDARVTLQATKGSAENLRLLQAGRGEIAFTLGDLLSGGWKGDKAAGFAKPLDKLRSVAGLYSNYVQIVASASSGIKTLADLKGRRIAVGARNSSAELNARAVLKAAGLGYADFPKVEHLSFGESAALIRDRQLDAALHSASLGAASIRELAMAVPIVIVPIGPEVVAAIGDAAYQPATIPAATYTGQTADLPTAAIRNFLVSHSGVSDDAVYAMTKAMFDNLPTLIAAHSAAKGIRLETAMTGTPVPFHPGAIRFYREAGVLK